MIDSSSKMIDDFLINNNRHKLIIHDGIEGLNSCDLGFELSIALLQVKDDKNFSFKSKEILTQICTNHFANHPEFGNYLSLKNLGILFHQEMKIDVNAFLKKHSISHPLFIEWEGETTANELIFLTKEKGIKIQIGDITHLNLLKA